MNQGSEREAKPDLTTGCRLADGGVPVAAASPAAGPAPRAEATPAVAAARVAAAISVITAGHGEEV